MSKKRTNRGKSFCTAQICKWHIAVLAALAVATLISPRYSHSATDSIPTPSWLERTAIADMMVINGLPSEVEYFTAERKVQDLIDFFRKRWDDTSTGGKGYREVDVGYWHVISRLEGRHLLTVQAREKDAFSSEGYLAVADLQDIRKSKRDQDAVPKMSGSEIVNESTSFDPGKKGRTLLILNDFSATTNSNYYKKYYRNRGWGQAMDQGSDSAKVLVFSKNDQTAHLVINEAGGVTRIVMNLVETE